MMKKLMIIAAVLLMAGCAKDGETGPQGPQGPAGQNGLDGTANVDSYTIIAGPSDWQTVAGQNTVRRVIQSVPEITQSTIDFGVVVVYWVQSDGSLIQLPAQTYIGSTLVNITPRVKAGFVYVDAWPVSSAPGGIWTFRAAWASKYLPVHEITESIKADMIRQ